jgi:hypothetical protein
MPIQESIPFFRNISYYSSTMPRALGWLWVTESLRFGPEVFRAKQPQELNPKTTPDIAKATTCHGATQSKPIRPVDRLTAEMWEAYRFFRASGCRLSARPSSAAVRNYFEKIIHTVGEKLSLG